MSARKRRNSTARRMSWLMVAGLTAGALLVPATSVSANDPHQSPPIAWNAAGVHGCELPRAR